MEGISTRVYKKVKSYWRRRRYQRLRTNRLDESLSNRRRLWRFRITPRMKVKLKFRLKLKLRYSPKKLLIGIRDGYVKMMMKMANSPVVFGSGGYGYGYGEGIANFGMKPMKEYDEKMIIEIYKSLAMRQAQLLPNDDDSKIVVSR